MNTRRLFCIAALVITLPIGCITDRAHEAYLSGRADAERDISMAVLAQENACRGLPAEWYEDYKQLLLERYGIQTRDVLYPNDYRREEARIRGYNDFAITEIERRFGTNIWASTRADAETLYENKRYRNQ